MATWPRFFRERGQVVFFRSRPPSLGSNRNRFAENFVRNDISFSSAILPVAPRDPFHRAPLLRNHMLSIAETARQNGHSRRASRLASPFGARLFLDPGFEPFLRMGSDTGPSHDAAEWN